MRTIDKIWRNIQRHSGEEFFTKTGVPFYYHAEEQRIVVPCKHCMISKRMFETALTIHPLSVVKIGAAKITGPSYVYSLLTDPRILSD